MKAWHDAECGSYTADLALWLELARTERGPVLDVGAGTGRVTRRLVAAGHEVVALDIDSELLEGLDCETVVADAQDFALGGRTFGLIIAPMQTVQLLEDRSGFLRCAREHLEDGGLLAVSLATEVEPFEAADLDPDGIERDGWTYLSTPIALRERNRHWEITRVREAHGPAGERTVEDDVIRLSRVSSRQLAGEAAEYGLRLEDVRVIEPTEMHVGAEVVLLRA